MKYNTLDFGLRDAIKRECEEDILNSIVSICISIEGRKLNDVEIWGFINLKEEIEILLLDGELSDVNYYLEELWDMCDKNNIFISL